MPGEAVTVEYRPADAVPAIEALPFRLAALARITAPLLEPPAKPSGPRPRALASCHLDVSCFPWLEDRESPAVALLLVTEPRGSYTCSGFLLARREPNDEEVLMLTAGHCVNTPEQARDLALLWRFQTETCYGDPDWEHWRSRSVFSYGAKLLERGRRRRS